MDGVDDVYFIDGNGEWIFDGEGEEVNVDNDCVGGRVVIDVKMD